MALDMTTRSGTKRSRRKKVKFRLIILLLFALFIAAASYAALNFNARSMPPILAVADKTARNRMNRAIDECLQKMTDQNLLETADFITQTADQSGMVNALTVNTVLVNRLASELAADLSDKLEDDGSQTIRIPYAALLGIEALANRGPTYPVSIYPVGAASVDYDSSFTSVGINQVNFQLWLNVDCAVRVANPVQHSDIVMSRKVTLVNTVFSGQVPETYLHNLAPAYSP